MKWFVGLSFIILFTCPLIYPNTPISTSSASLIQSFIPIAKWDDAGWFDMCAGVADVNNGSEAVMWANGSHVLAFNNSGGLLWTVDGLTEVDDILCGDFDRDGYIDDFYHNRHSNTVDGSEAYNESGQLITSAVDGIPHYANYTASNNWYGVGDLDHDGYADDIALVFKNGTNPFVCVFPCVEGPGQAHWNYTIPGAFKGTIQVGDLDGDGYRDDVVVMASMNWTFAFNETGGLLWSFPAGGGGPGTIHARLLIADFDRDGYPNEVAMSCESDGYIHVINRTGHELWNYSLDFQYTYLAAGDFDRDGYEDDLAYTTALQTILHVADGSGLESWNFTSPWALTRITVADFDGDGLKNDFFIAGILGGFAFDGLGHLIGRGARHGASFFGDFDGDGREDDMLHSSTSWSLRKFRFSYPHVSINPLNLDRSYTEGPTGWSFNISNQEIFPLDTFFNYSAPHYDGWHAQTIGVGSYLGYGFSIDLVPGIYNITFTIVYENAPFYALTFEVTVGTAIGSSPLSWFLVVISILGIIGVWQQLRNTAQKQLRNTI